MNGLEVFFFTELEERGRIKDFFGWNIDLVDVANVFLTPLRVLWNGRTVKIVRTITGNLEGIHHIASFHPRGKDHACLTDDNLYSSQSDWILTVLAIVCLIPGLLIGVPLKVMAHAWESTRLNYRLICDHFSHSDLHVGSDDEPVSERTEDRAFETTKDEHMPLNKKVDHLIIHGDGEFVLTARGNFIRQINPKKIILVGTALFRGNAPSAWRHPMRAGKDAIERAVDQGREVITGEFLPALVKSGKFEIEEDSPKVYTVESVEKAKAHRPPKQPNGRRYHALYQVTAVSAK